MQEAEFIRRTDSIESLGSLDFEDDLGSNASMHDDKSIYSSTRNDGPIDYDMDLEQFVLNGFRAICSQSRYGE